jgi:long-chain acyl-CoA synthetase
MNLSAVLQARAIENADKTALFCGNAMISYRELDAASTALALWFLDQGLRPGERVAIHWSNSIEVVQLFFALFKAGLIAVTVNVRLKPPEIGYILEHSEARLCFSEAALAPLARQAGARCAVRSEFPALGVASAGTKLPTINPDDPAIVLYTSGTTARPKGVTHTHCSLLNTAAMMVRETAGAENVSLAITQMMHAAALNMVVLPALYSGASAVLLPAYDPAAVLDAIERFRCSYALCLPALLQFVVECQAQQPRRVSSLKTVLAGGDTVSLPLQQRFQDLFGQPLQEVYGMTEAVPITVNPKSAVRQGSIGVRVEGLDLRIADLEGHDVAEGQTGEMLVRGPATCIGYWNDPNATRAALIDGWLCTGDLASRDADGYYWFQGRKKEIIIRAGSNISPQEVEEALYKHPAVLEAGVIGAPDPIYGETVAAFVVLRKSQTMTPQELRQFAAQYLADYKLPERILFLEELPKSPTGKVRRRALREMLPESADPQQAAAGSVANRAG